MPLSGFNSHRRRPGFSSWFVRQTAHRSRRCQPLHLPPAPRVQWRRFSLDVRAVRHRSQCEGLYRQTKQSLQVLWFVSFIFFCLNLSILCFPLSYTSFSVLLYVLLSFLEVYFIKCSLYKVIRGLITKSHKQYMIHVSLQLFSYIVMYSEHLILYWTSIWLWPSSWWNTTLGHFYTSRWLIYNLHVED